MKNNDQQYHSLLNQHTTSGLALKKKSLILSVLRLSAAIGFGLSLYYYFNTDKQNLLIVTAVSVVVFFVLIKIHNKLVFKRKINDALIAINKDEINYIKNNELNFNNGSEYIDVKHSYAYDLDIFGEKSLFQTINRTATYIGENSLANSLLNQSENTEITNNQEAIKELSAAIEWRQKLNAFAKTTEDNKDTYTRLMNWSKKLGTKINLPLIIFSYASPIVYFSAVIGSFISDNPLFGDIALYLFLINLMVMGSQLKLIMSEMESATKINKTLKNYSLIIQQLEQKTFQSKKLTELKNQLKDADGLASEQIEKLSSLFAQLDNASNLVVATLFNGTFLYNLHTLRSLYTWKANHQTKINNWLNVIGELEKLSSYANFAFNNPQFCYPTLNNKHEIDFKNLAHPLLKEGTRVSNDVNFSSPNFIILTGSNMAGKSTFLRSLGVNMVLANTGSVVCATQATVHPLPICVSMRLSDSLTDSESYFFAEVKRLKEIMDKAEKSVSFILLDEILRGTNSEDKRNGTVEVIKKMIAKNAIGAIATHDLKVCDITKDYPDTLTNKCFEVEIIDNELHFDYQLRPGVCKNKSATFLMKKMGVI